MTDLTQEEVVIFMMGDNWRETLRQEWATLPLYKRLYWFLRGQSCERCIRMIEQDR